MHEERGATGGDERRERVVNTRESESPQSEGQHIFFFSCVLGESIAQRPTAAECAIESK